MKKTPGKAWKVHAPLILTPKPWGKEELWAKTGRYAAKVLTIKPGEQLSYQYHRFKVETILVIKGTLGLIIGQKYDSNIIISKRELGVGEFYHIHNLVPHRFSCIGDEECVIVEASYPNLEDVVRIEDRYNRAKEGGDGLWKNGKPSK